MLRYHHHQVIGDNTKYQSINVACQHLCGSDIQLLITFHVLFTFQETKQ